MKVGVAAFFTGRGIGPAALAQAPPRERPCLSADTPHSCVQTRSLARGVTRRGSSPPPW